MKKLAIGIVAALAGVALLASMTTRRASARASSTSAGPSLRAVQSLPRSPVARAAPSPSPASIALEDFREASVYPPDSRPLRPTDRQLIEWNRRHESPRPACGSDRPLRFSADRHWLVGDDALAPFVELDAASPWRVRSARAEVIDSVTGAVSEPRSFDLERFFPAELGLEQPARIRLSVDVDCGNGQTEERAIHVIYTPESAIPARFDGTFRDSIEAGSLVIHAGVEVDVAGWFVVDGNLYDAHDRPIAWSRFKGELALGRQELALRFFGKVLIDSGGEAPYRLGELRGARHAPGRDPDLEPMPPYLPGHVVGDLDLGELSDAEWDAPEKRAKLERLEREASDPDAPRIRAAR